MTDSRFDPARRRAPAAQTPRRREARRRRWTVLAVLFPLFFFVVIALGLVAMYFRHMEFFKPARVGWNAAAPSPASATPAAPA